MHGTCIKIKENQTFLSMVTAICETVLGWSCLLVKFSTTCGCEVCHICFDSVQGWIHICLHLYVPGFCYVAFRKSSAQRRVFPRSASTRGEWQVSLIILRQFCNAFRRQIIGPGYCHLRLVAAVFHLLYRNLIQHAWRADSSFVSVRGISNRNTCNKM
jgi:hypothetical protein